MERGSICYAKCVKVGLSFIVPHTFFLSNSITHFFNVGETERLCVEAGARGSVHRVCLLHQAARAVPVAPKSPRVSALVERFSPPVTGHGSRVRRQSGPPVLAWRRERDSRAHGGEKETYTHCSLVTAHSTLAIADTD